MRFPIRSQILGRRGDGSAKEGQRALREVEEVAPCRQGGLGGRSPLRRVCDRRPRGEPRRSARDRAGAAGRGRGRRNRSGGGRRNRRARGSGRDAHRPLHRRRSRRQRISRAAHRRDDAHRRRYRERGADRRLLRALARLFVDRLRRGDPSSRRPHRRHARRLCGLRCRRGVGARNNPRHASI